MQVATDSANDYIMLLCVFRGDALSGCSVVLVCMFLLRYEFECFFGGTALSVCFADAEWNVSFQWC